MKKLNGSNPISHPSQSRESTKDIDVLNFEVRHIVSQLSDYAPGGEDNLTIQMRAQLVKLHTTGNRWYVSYYTKQPSGKLKRHKAYGYVNAEKNLEKRMQLLIELQKRIFESLQQGNAWNEQPIIQSTNIFKCTNKLLADKKEYLKKTAYRSVRIKLGPWKKWLLEAQIAGKHPSVISKVDILNYRNWLLLQNITNRTINNYMDEVRALFSYMVNHLELITRNPCNNISNLPTRSETHVRYTEDEQIKIAVHLRETDSILLLYIQFIAYCFLRTNEARRLQIKHFDFTNNKILLTAENNKVNKRVWKIIPNIFKTDLLFHRLEQYPKEWFVFGKNGLPGPVNVGENFFRKRFKKVKTKFGLSNKHTLYGFRHTSVSQLVENGERWTDIMKLTGHTQMESFQKYAKSVLGTEPKDLSRGFKVKM